MRNLIKKSKSHSVWNLGNQVLYELCKNHNQHKIDSEILAKIWLIGRSYAAAIERRKNDDKNINDDFYITVVAPIIRKSNIDVWFMKCEKSEQIADYLDVHKKLTDLFNKISGLNKRSLASKYLHFHFPTKFYIYDTRAVKAVNLLVKKYGIKKYKKNRISNLYDKEYEKFYLKCFDIKEMIREIYNVKLSCRELDTLLIEVANSNLRMK